MAKVKVVVIGAGVVGMSTAVCIAEVLPFCTVKVLSEKFSPDTTSDVAAGILLPKEIPGRKDCAKIQQASVLGKCSKQCVCTRYSCGTSATLV